MDGSDSSGTSMTSLMIASTIFSSSLVNVGSSALGGNTVPVTIGSVSLGNSASGIVLSERKQPLTPITMRVSIHTIVTIFIIMEKQIITK